MDQDHLIERDSVITLERTVGGWQQAFTSRNLLEASGRLPPGLYTTLRTYGGSRVLRPEAHAARLSEGGVSVSAADVRAAVRAALDAGRHPESRLRLTMGEGGAFFASVEAFEALPEDLYRKGVDAVSVALHREDPGAKSTGFISTAAAAYRQLPPGAHEGLLLGAEGAILEGLSSNVFLVRGGRLFTAGDEVLPGVTRSLVLEVAARVLPVTLEPVRLTDLGSVSEAFLTSVSRGVLPLVRIDGRPVGDGAPGPETRRVAQDFAALVEREAVLV